MKKIYGIIMVNIKKLKTRNIYILGKKIVLFIICSKCDSKDKKIFKEEESTEILRIIGLINNIG